MNIKLIEYSGGNGGRQTINDWFDDMPKWADDCTLTIDPNGVRVGAECYVNGIAVHDTVIEKEDGIERISRAENRRRI